LVAELDAIRAWNDFVGPLLKDQEKFKLEIIIQLIILLANFGYGLLLLASILLHSFRYMCEIARNYYHEAEPVRIRPVHDIVDIFPDEESGTADNDSVSGDKDDDYDSDDESTSLLTRMLRSVTLKGTGPSSIEKSSPPLPTSETYLADLLRYEFSRSKRNRFCYIRCLDPVDRETFQAKMIEQIEVNCKDREKQELIITQGCMKMRTWRRIMKQICTVTTYKLWRSAYWGENAGRPNVSPTRTNYHVLVESFDGQGRSKEVNLLHSIGHIERIPSSLLSPSSWSNGKVSQQIWEEISD